MFGFGVKLNKKWRQRKENKMNLMFDAGVGPDSLARVEDEFEKFFCKKPKIEPNVSGADENSILQFCSCSSDLTSNLFEKSTLMV